MAGLYVVAFSKNRQQARHLVETLLWGTPLGLDPFTLPASFARERTNFSYAGHTRSSMDTDISEGEFRLCNGAWAADRLKTQKSKFAKSKF
jgi:hypothetical protein